MGKNRSVRIDLPVDVWKVIDTQFKPLNGGNDSEILRDIIKKHLAENAYFKDLDSLDRGHGMKDHYYSSRYDNGYNTTIRKKRCRHLPRVESNNARKNNEIITNKFLKFSSNCYNISI